MAEKDPPNSASNAAIEPASRASKYPMSRLAPRFDLVDVAREIQNADQILGSVVGGQLDVIAEQIRNLQGRAREILERAERSAELHRAACNFRKIAGHVYHLYRRPGGDAYLSMLSPSEWGDEPPHAYEGSYRLELDMTWSRLDG